MDEFKFVVKCLIFSCLIVIFSQTRIQGETLESKAFAFLQHSETAHWIRAAADGGVTLVRQGTDQLKNFMNDKFSGNSSKAEEQPSQSNTGLFRKLEKEKTQQRGEAAESLLEENSNEDRF